MAKFFQLADEKGIIATDEKFDTIEEVWNWVAKNNNQFTKEEIQNFVVYEMKPINFDYEGYQEFIKKIENPAYKAAEHASEYVFYDTPYYPGPINHHPINRRYWFYIYGGANDPIGKVSFNYDETPE